MNAGKQNWDFACFAAILDITVVDSATEKALPPRSSCKPVFSVSRFHFLANLVQPDSGACADINFRNRGRGALPAFDRNCKLYGYCGVMAIATDPCSIVNGTIHIGIAISNAAEGVIEKR